MSRQQAPERAQRGGEVAEGVKRPTRLWRLELLHLGRLGRRWAVRIILGDRFVDRRWHISDLGLKVFLLGLDLLHIRVIRTAGNLSGEVG